VVRICRRVLSSHFLIQPLKMGPSRRYELVASTVVWRFSLCSSTGKVHSLGAREGAASGETGNRYAIHDLRVNGDSRYIFTRDVYRAIRARLGSRHFCDISAATTRLLLVYATSFPALNGTTVQISLNRSPRKVTKSERTNKPSRDHSRILNRGISNRRNTSA